MEAGVRVACMGNRSVLIGLLALGGRLVRESRASLLRISYASSASLDLKLQVVA